MKLYQRFVKGKTVPWLLLLGYLAFSLLVRMQPWAQSPALYPPHLRGSEVRPPRPLPPLPPAEPHFPPLEAAPVAPAAPDVPQAGPVFFSEGQLFTIVGLLAIMLMTGIILLAVLAVPAFLVYRRWKHKEDVNVGKIKTT